MAYYVAVCPFCNKKVPASNHFFRSEKNKSVGICGTCVSKAKNLVDNSSQAVVNINTIIKPS